MVTAERIRTGETDPPFVLVRSFGDSGIDLRGIVKTRTVEENFSACSDIRRAIKAAVDADPDVEFAYPHMQIVETESRKTPEGRMPEGRIPE
jgi:small-conductance mechanosensitive channel